MPLAHGATFEFSGEQGQVSWREEVASYAEADRSHQPIGAYMRRVSRRRHTGGLLCHGVALDLGVLLYYRSIAACPSREY